MATQTPALRARTGSVTATVIAHRPSWRDMEKNYPAETIGSGNFYPMVGKAYARAANDPDPVIAASYANTCAARMSYALNRSGLRLPTAPNGGSLKGDDGYNYWLRVAQLREKLKQHFGAADKQLIHQKVGKILTQSDMNSRVQSSRGFIAGLGSMKGIVVFEVSGWSDASGHFTLWDGQNLKYVGPGEHNNPSSSEYYFWLTRVNAANEIIVQTNKVLFWELK
jgi:Type VI secretion system (T6SS), amidase effector protein 4